MPNDKISVFTFISCALLHTILRPTSNQLSSSYH
nr:MAG TPA: hypothetical protein [Microviridae sp.]